MASQTPEGPLVTTSSLAVSILLPILGTIAVTLRFFAKYLASPKLSPDDWVITLTLLCAWGVSISTFVGASSAGIDNPTPDPSSVEVFSQATRPQGFLLIASLVLVKIAILLFYYRIFVTPVFRIAVWVYIGILLAWGIANCVAWGIIYLLATDPSICDYFVFLLTFSSMGLVFDVIVLCFPLPVIKKLQMPWRRKLQVIGIFGLGIFCCITSVIRLYYSMVLMNQCTSATPDIYTGATSMFMWGMVEPNISIIVACLPTYGPFFGNGRGIHSPVQVESGRKYRGEISSSSAQTQAKGFPLLKPIDCQYGQSRIDGSNHSYDIDIRTTSTDDDPVVSSMNVYQVKVVREFIQH